MVRASVLAALVCVQVGCLKSPQSHLDRGNRLMAAGEYPGAEIEYRKSIQQAPRFAEAYYRLGLLDYQLQQGTEALENLQRARSLDPGNQRYSIDFASVAIEAFQVMPDKKYLYEQAVQEADSLLQKDPASFEGLRLRGDIAVIDRKYDAALADFEKADRIRPNDPNVVLATTQVLFALNKNDEGEALARRFLDVHREFAPMYDLMAEHYQNQNRPKDADRLLESEVAARPRDAHAWLQLAKLYRATGRTEEMTATLQRIAGDRAAFPEGALKVGDFYAGYAEWDKAVVEYRGGLDRAAGPAKLLYHRKLETAFEALGKRQEALAELHEILASNPQDASARLNRAVLLRQSQDAKEQESATQELKLLVSQYPNDAVVRYNLAMSYSSRGDQESAAREAKASADLQKDYVAPRLLLAGLANGRHDAAAALEAAQQVLAIDPNNTAARLVRAVAWIDSKSYREAESDLRTIANQQPDSANVQEEVQLVSAQLAAAQNNYAQAEALYRRVYRPGSRDLRPLEGLIRLYNREHRPEQAQKLLEDAAKRDPQSAALYSALGGMYRDQGNAQAALTNFEKAKELNPDDPKILNTIAVLQSDTGQSRQAVATLTRELVLDPANPAAMNNLAFNLAETGQDLDHALSLALNVAHQYPDDPSVIDTLGWVYTQRGMNQLAIQALRVLVKKYPAEPAYHYHLAVALLRNSQPGDARSELRAAEADHPSQDLAGKIQANLAQVQ